MRRSPLARPLTAIAAAVLVSGVLAGCSGFSISGACDPEFAPGDASNAVTASGPAGSAPAIEFPTPLITDAAQRTVLIAGDGDEIGPYDTVEVAYTVFDAETGLTSDSTGYDATTEPLRLTAGNGLGAFGDALLCAKPGARLALTAPVELFSDTADGEEPALGGTSFVVVIDVLNVWLGKANGVNQLPQDGMPTVVTAVDGTPGITVSTLAIPTELRSATIKAGGGATIAEGDAVITHVRSWTWSPAGTVTIGETDTWGATPRAPGLYTADSDDPVIATLIGAKVGSQLLVVVPSDDPAAGATILVFDILGIDDAE